MIVVFLLASLGLSPASTLEVFRIFQPLSLHGTDVDADFEGEAVQARVLSRPMVLSGALPEGVVAAVGASHRMPAVPNYTEPECNLLQLYGVEIYGLLVAENNLTVTLDLKKAKVPAKVNLPIRTVLRLAISALKKTLKDFHHSQNNSLKVRLVIAGLTRQNASLRDLGEEFEVKGR